MKLLVYKPDGEESLDSILVFIDEKKGETIKDADNYIYDELHFTGFSCMATVEVSQTDEVYTLHAYEG